MPLLRPILRLLGFDATRMEKAFAEAKELERMAEEIASVPDRYNDLFAPRGWVIYDLMNIEVAKAAIQKAELGDIDGAEPDLVDYYDAETVAMQLRWMSEVKAFRPRMPLAKKALIDYQEERYHACVPVILALLDGLVSEVHEQNRGFFAKNVNLEAWDSVSAHSKGLNALANIFKKGRQKTTTEPITIPYRHGIMHGRDLGYDNKMVAAKTWAALFATRDWALKAEQGILTAPPDEPKKTWREIFQQMRDIADDRTLLEQWIPRTLQIGENVPRTGTPDSYGSNTPEHRLAAFLSFWKARNYGYMAKCLPVDVGYPLSRIPALIREHYGMKGLKAFEFVAIDDKAAAITEIQTGLVYEENDKVVEKVVRFRMVNEDSEGRPEIRGKSGSTWVVMNWNVEV